MTSPHLTTIAAALFTAGGVIWTAAMNTHPVERIGGVICGLHQATQTGIHCSWCYAALAMIVAGAGVLSVAGARCLKPSAKR